MPRTDVTQMLFSKVYPLWVSKAQKKGRIREGADQVTSWLTGYRPEEIRGLYLNFHYDGHHLQCITGTSLNTFTMDKSIEREWDQEVKNILKSRSIEGDY